MANLNNVSLNRVALKTGIFKKYSFLFGIWPDSYMLLLGLNSGNMYGGPSGMLI